MKKLLLVMAIVFAVIVVGAGCSNVSKVNSAEMKYQQIENLYDAKANLLLEKNVDNEKIKSIERQLQDLGVEFLTPTEVSQRFTTGDINTKVGVPYSSNVSWSSYRVTYTYSGKTYEVQRLVAQANASNSNLKGSGSRAISTNYKWQAGAMNLLKAVALQGAGSIPIVGNILNFFDAVSGTVSAISRTTEIDGADAIYSWSQVTTVIFAYVKLNGASDNDQSLTYISSKCNAATGYQIPTFYYKNSNGTMVVTPGIIQGQRTFTVTPTGYDSTYNAVYAYVNYPYAQTRATVDSIGITGLDNQTVSYIYPVSPSFPAQVY